MADNTEPGGAPAAHSHSVHQGEPDTKGRRITPWAWIPSVYFAQGLQYAIVIQLFAIVFFTMGVPQGVTLFWVGLLSFPWTLKPLWGPLVDKYGTKRAWTWLMQFLVGAAFIGTAVSLLLPGTIPIGGGPFNLAPFMWGAIIFLGILAFAAATHDIACDGYYMLGLNEKQQAFYVGIRSTLFRAALIFANGILIWIAGVVQGQTGLPAVQSELNVRPPGEAVQVQSAEPDAAPLSADLIETVFATEHWPQANEETIQILPATLEAEPGETGYVTVRLSQPPPEGESRTVVLRLTEADKGISIPRSFQRLEFTAENWRQGIDIPVESDERISAEAIDFLRAEAGNIPFSWFVVTLICAGIFITVAVWHKFVLPFPAEDTAVASSDRPPFIVPLFCIFVAIVIPFAAAWGFMWVLGQFKAPIQEATIGEVRAPAFQNLRGTLENEVPEDQVDAEVIWGTIQSMREEQLAMTAGNLDAVVTLRRTLMRQGLLNEAEVSTRIMEFIQAKEEDPDLYGNAFLRRVLIQLRTLNDGELPETEEELEEILNRARNPELAELPEDADALLGAVSATEAAFGDYVIPRLELAAFVREVNNGSLPASGPELADVLAANYQDLEELYAPEPEPEEATEEEEPAEEAPAEEAAAEAEPADGEAPAEEMEIRELTPMERVTAALSGEGLSTDFDTLLMHLEELAERYPEGVPEEVEIASGLPRTQAQFDEVVEMARQTPSALAVKGYNSGFTVGRLVLLLLIGFLLIKLPLTWEPIKAGIYGLSNASRIGFADVFATFFTKSGIGVTLGFLLTFRLGEAQLAQVKNLFLLDERAVNGLAMSLGEVAFVNSVIYLGMLTLGGILGGFLISKYGLKKVIWIMVAFMHLPNALYIWLAADLPQSIYPVWFVVGFESFGYGFGFTAYLMVMILAAQGPYKTAHYALCTGAMALGYMVPGMWSGYLQELTGYVTFFVLVLFFTLPGVILIPFMKIDPTFGKKEE